MSGFAVARGRYEPGVARRASGWERYYLRKAVLADFGCATMGVSAAAQITRFTIRKQPHRQRAVSCCMLSVVAVGHEAAVSPALLDVAGPRTTIRPTAGLTVLHVDQPQLSCLPETDNCVCRQTCRGVIKVRSARVSV